MGKIAFLFAGQDAYTPGMVRELSACGEAAAGVFEVAGKALGQDVASLCAGNGPAAGQMQNIQAGVLAADLAAFAALKEQGVNAHCVAGYSLGETAALVAAGVLRLEQALAFVQRRAEAIQAAVPFGRGGMVSVLCRDDATVDELCAEVSRGYIAKASMNAPGQIVLAGDDTAVDEAAWLAKEKGAKPQRLPGSWPLHCAMMAPAADAALAALEALPLQDATLPVYMNVDGQSAHRAGDIREKLALQIKSPVQWAKTLQAMRADGVDTFVELGPGRALSALVQATVKDVAVFRVENRATLEETVSFLQF